MSPSRPLPTGRSAGWVVAAIVAVVAVCAVAFMVTQRPREAMAVAQGDPLTGEMLRGPLPATAPPKVKAPAMAAASNPDTFVVDSANATAAGARAAAAANRAAASREEPALARSANDAGAYASATEPAR